MIQKIKALLLALSISPMFLLPALVPVAVSAQTPNIRGNLCQGAEFRLTPDGQCVRRDTSSFQGTLARIINVLSIIIGVVAVIMIIWGGFKYITSSGNADKVTSAKNTLIYAIIGLIIVALAQAIVRFVLTETPNV